MMTTERAAASGHVRLDRIVAAAGERKILVGDRVRMLFPNIYEDELGTVLRIYEENDEAHAVIDLGSDRQRMLAKLRHLKCVG